MQTTEYNCFPALTKSDYDTLNAINNNTDEINYARAWEWSKIRMNPLYYLLNYVYLPEIGGNLTSCKYSKELLHPKLRRVVRGLHRYHNVIMMASRQMGKALHIETLIPKPDGKWTTMGNLKVDDIILDQNGNPTKVNAVTDIMYNHECYEIIFDSFDKIIADKDHLWKISSTPYKKKDIIINTEELFKLSNTSSSERNGMPYINMTSPIKNKKKKLILDPYLLGLWLGNGSKSGSRIHIHINDYNEISLDLISKGYEISDLKRESELGGYFGIYKILPIMNELNILNNKHIPDIYLAGSVKQRIELLRGLMDSDGNCSSQTGSCEFYQKESKLILQVKELLTSLGIKSRIKSKTINCETYYTLKFCTRMFYVFNLKRKRELQKKCKNHPKNRRVYINSIKKIESVPVKCIAVDNEDNMFLAGFGMIPTHNSTIAAVMISWAINFYKDNRAAIKQI